MLSGGRVLGFGRRTGQTCRANGRAQRTEEGAIERAALGLGTRQKHHFFRWAYAVGGKSYQICGELA